MNMKVKTSDAIVDTDDAAAWVQSMIREVPGDVIARAINTEQFVLGVAIHTASRTIEKLRARGVAEPILDDVFDKIVLTSAFTIELMQKGYRKLWDEFIDPDVDSKIINPQDNPADGGDDD